MGTLDVVVVAVGSSSGIVAFITAASTFLQDRLRSRRPSEDEDNLEATTVTIKDKEGNVILTLQSDGDERVREVIREIAAIGATDSDQPEGTRDTRKLHFNLAGGAPPDVPYLTVAEVAATMRVSKMTVYKMIHSGELHAIRTGRSFRVPEPEVSSYLKRIEVT